MSQAAGAGIAGRPGPDVRPNRRRAPRWPTDEAPLRVFIAGDASPLGQVLDFHARGLRLVTRRSQEAERLVDLELEFPRQAGQRHRVPLEARTAWVRGNPATETFETGFEFVGIGPDADEPLKSFVRRSEEAAHAAGERSARLEAVIDRYEAALDTMSPAMSADQALAVLDRRDEVRTALRDGKAARGPHLARTAVLDRRLHRQAPWILRVVDQADHRAELGTTSDAWWWSLAPRTVIFWRVASIVVLTAATSLLLDVSSRFFRGGPDQFGLVAVVGPAILTLLTAKSTLLARGANELAPAFPKTMPLRGLRFLHLRFTACLAILAIAFSLHASLTWIANAYTRRGWSRQKAEDLSGAYEDYSRAVALNVGIPGPHLYLARLLESLGDESGARAEYRVTLRNCSDPGICARAANNLARLDILGGRYAEAVSELRRWAESLPNDPMLGYYTKKNMGWARLKQGRLKEAHQALDAALTIAGTRSLPQNIAADAHCLLAETLEAEGQAQLARPQWFTCLRYVNAQTDEGDGWGHSAQERIAKRDAP